MDDELRKRPIKKMDRVKFDYQPLLEGDVSKFRIVVPFPKVAWFTVSLPFFGFFFCVGWSVMYNFEHATSTHCNVYNFLPSVSAAIGHYRPQSDVWKAAIAIQAIIRAWILLMYYWLYKETVPVSARGISNFALLSYSLENISLVTLSFWTSNENYAFHKVSFIMFLIMSLVHMLTAYFIMQNCRNVSKDPVDIKSILWKYRMLMINVMAILSACYFFYRHNQYCEPFVYSMFALAEYLVVISNMGFHLTAALDFYGKSILISSRGIRLI